MLYTYQGSGTTFWHVPLYDIFGSTVELVDASNPGTPVSLYKYDPYGVPTYTSTQRPPWPFLYHGMEQEYPDSWKLYWEPNGNVYNPDPFQLSLSGPQGLGGGGGPRRLGGFEGNGGLGWNYAQGATNGAALGASYLAITTDATLAASELGPWGLAAAGAFDIFASLGLFGGGGPSGPPLYDILRTQHRAHDIYPWLGIAMDLLVNQKIAKPEDPCPPVPGGHRDALIHNIQEARRNPGALYLGAKMMNGGGWDYRNKETFSDGDAFGNFNYGACAAAAGYKNGFTLRWAGFYHQHFGTISGDEAGTPFGNFPYGNRPLSESEVAKGIQFVELGCDKM